MYARDGVIRMHFNAQWIRNTRIPRKSILIINTKTIILRQKLMLF